MGLEYFGPLIEGERDCMLIDKCRSGPFEMMLETASSSWTIWWACPLGCRVTSD